MFNGSGTYTLPGAALANGGTVSATEHNQFRDDVATALNLCVLKDGQQTITANLPMNSKKLTGLAAGTTAGDSVRFEQLPNLATPGPIGGTTPSTGAFTTLTTTSTINGLTVGKGGGSVATNTVVGASALNANTTGANNTAVGYRALYSTTTGASNTAVGYYAGNGNAGGTYNTYVGLSAGQAANGDYNTSIGTQSGYNITGTRNTMLGFDAGFYVTSGSRNTLVGAANTINEGPGYYITTGTANTILGAYTGNQGGLDIRTANNYIVLSDGDGNPRAYSDSNGYFNINSKQLNLYPGASTNLEFVNRNGSGMSFFVNNASVTASLSVTGVWTNASDARLKKNIRDIEYGLSTVIEAKPHSYERNDVDGKFIGFVAQELKQIIPEVVFGSDDDQYTVDYGSLVAVAFKAIQELSAKNSALEARLTALGAK